MGVSIDNAVNQNEALAWVRFENKLLHRRGGHEMRWWGYERTHKLTDGQNGL